MAWKIGYYTKCGKCGMFANQKHAFGRSGQASFQTGKVRLHYFAKLIYEFVFIKGIFQMYAICPITYMVKNHQLQGNICIK